MPTPYHRNLQRLIRELGRKNPGRFARVFNDKRPVHITHPMKADSILYYPDVTYETSTDKLYVFEIMDSKAFSQAQVVAHVLETILTPHISKHSS